MNFSRMVLMLVSFLAFWSVLSEPGQAYRNKRQMRLSKVTFEKFQYTAKLRKKAHNNGYPTYIVKGCPLVSGTYVCRPNFKPKINRTYTSTKNTTATLSIPYDVTLKARIKKLTASSFEFLTNRSDVIINLEMSTYGRASWVFYRVQSTSPQTPPYPPRSAS